MSGRNENLENNTMTVIDASKDRTVRPSPIGYVREVNDELRKVAWPTRREVVRRSILTIGLTIVSGAFIAGADSLFARVADLLY